MPQDYRHRSPLFSAAVLLFAAGHYGFAASQAAAQEHGPQPLETAHETAAAQPVYSSPKSRPPLARTRTSAEAPDEHGEHAEHESHLRNAIGLGFAYAAQWVREEENQGTTQSLFGFSLLYDRILIPSHLGISIRKPFLFAGGRFDSPLDVVLEGLLERKHWEFFLGVGVTLNLRAFQREMEGEADGVKLSFGIPVVTGVNLLIARHWSVQMEVGYGWTVTKEPVNHALNTLLTALYHF